MVVVGGGGGWWVVGVEGENRNKLGACQFLTENIVGPFKVENLLFY